MLFKFFLALLILTNEIRCSSYSETSFDNDSEEETKSLLSESDFGNDFVSPTSVVLVPSSPKVSMKSVTEMKSDFFNISEDLILMIAEYLEFPHKTLGGVCRCLRALLSTVTPAQVISRRLNISEFNSLPTCPDLKYLIALDSRALKDERILYGVTDLALIKHLPNIKSKVLRIIYSKLKYCPFIKRIDVLKSIHPFETSHLVISTLVHAFIMEGDFEMVFRILDDFPELHLIDFVFNEAFILAAIQFQKTETLFKLYARNASIQFKFDLACNILSLSLDPVVLEWFMRQAYNDQDAWNENYTQTYLNAWNYAMVYSSERIKLDKYPVLEEVFSFIQRLPVQQGSLNLFKNVLIVLIAIRTGISDQIGRVLDELCTIINGLGNLQLNYQRLFEDVLFCLLVEGQYSYFFSFLNHLQLLHFETSKLRTAISKRESEEFITILIEAFDVNRLFAGNMERDAFYNKRLLFHIVEVADEVDFIESSSLDQQLFNYAVEHFKDDLSKWEMFFSIHKNWPSTCFSGLFYYLLEKLQNILVFEMISELIHDEELVILDTWVRPALILNVKSAEFLVKNEQIHPLLIHLNRFMDFRLEHNVMPHLISTNACDDGNILKIFKFHVKDLLIQLNHWIDHENYIKLFGVSEDVYFSELKSAIQELKQINILSTAQSQLDASILNSFNPILSKLKFERPLEYLLLLPQSILERVASEEPELMRRALMNDDFKKILIVLKQLDGREIKVKGPFDSYHFILILWVHGVDLTIV